MLDRSLSRRRAQAVPGVADLVVMHLWQVVRGVEAERLDVEPADGAEQRIGSDDAVALGADQARFGQDQVLLRVQHIDGGALAAGGFLLHAGQRHGGGADFGFGGRHRDLGAFVGDPGADGSGAGLVAHLIQYQPALRQTSLACLVCEAARPPS